VKDLHPELRRVIRALHIEEESRKLLFAAVAEKGRSPHAALQLLWLVEDLRADAATALTLLEKKERLENLLTLIRQGHKNWVGRVCRLLYEGTLPLHMSGPLLPTAMIRGLLQWVKGEQTEKIREILWAVLLQKGVGLEEVAKVADLAPALCEADPITRNNAVRFLFDHFTPEEVVESLFHFSILTGRSVPGLAYRRYVSLLKGEGGLKLNKEVVNRILSSATLEERHIKEIFLDYVTSLNRFDLIRILSSCGGSLQGISDLRRKGGQMDFPFDVRKTVCSQHDGFSERCTSLWRVDFLPQ
jgi:hypothetical protein